MNATLQVPDTIVDFTEALKPMRERLLANLVMIAQIPAPTGAEAWGEFKREVHRTGYYGTPQFSHPLIQRAIDIMGWREMCLSEDPEGVLRGQFLKIYATLDQRENENRVALTGGNAAWGQITKLAAKMKALPGGK